MSWKKRVVLPDKDDPAKPLERMRMAKKRKKASSFANIYISVIATFALSPRNWNIKLRESVIKIPFT